MKVLNPADGNTPLDPDEADELIPTHITTRDQLNAWEQQNIALAVQWLSSTRNADVLDIGFLRELHRRMFDSTWRWAGSFRRTLKSIGVPAPHIATDLANLIADARYWVEHRTYLTDEVAARFHHRLVSIHPFANGNGRHARLATDALLTTLDAQPLTWGSGDLDRDGDARSRYLDALRKADRDEYEELITFLRS